MYFFVTFLTGVALSLDAFSLAIAYGTVLKEKEKIMFLSVIVGIFHFFMPLFGYSLSNLLILKLISNTNIISFLIFLILGIEMFFSKNENNNIINLSSITNIFLFAFTVSIDSFSIGIAIVEGTIIVPIIIFSLVSALFTYIGLIIGQKLDSFFGKYTTKVGGVILMCLSIYYLFT